MREGRWNQVTPSQFAHERAALEHVRLLLPDLDPYRAWANFTFTAGSGHIHEVDLLVAAPSGLYLIEIKSLAGTLTSSGSDWVQTNRGTRVFKNPLHLADQKAKQLKTLLQAERGRQRVSQPIPFIKAAVFLSVPGLRVELPEHQRHWVYGPEPKPGDQQGPLPGIWSGLLRQAPQNERERISHTLSAAMPRLLEGISIARSRTRFRVGAWELEQRPFDVGPTWQDHHARHSQLRQETRRIRLYLAELNAPDDARATVERAARREMVALHGISHPGIVRVDTLEPHEGGTALVFRHDQRARRLDQYMTEYGERLDAMTRVGMIRQLAEAVGYAHGRRLYHRALSARSVFVLPGKSNGRDPRDDPWLRPQLQISDWQAAARVPGTPRNGNGNGTTSTTQSGGSTPQVTPTRHVVEHVDRAAEPYLAPELSTPDPDSIGLDVFGLGTLSYLLLAGQAPAGDRTELRTRLTRENGLRPSSVADSVSELMDELVQAATAPGPAQRLGSVDEFVEMLTSVEKELTAEPEPTVEAAPDPLDARPGDLIDGQWRVLRRLGTGSTSRAFLTSHEPTEQQHVLKIALSDEKAQRLEHEARALRPLRDYRVIHLAQRDPIRIGIRSVLVLEHAGGQTVARKLRDEGRLTVDELDTLSHDLFEAELYLEGEGVTHRDIKPDNIAIRTRPNRTRHLVLFDFSLAGVSVRDTQAGTPRYLDPFIGTIQRPVYDAHAERYALAVTLHEMASAELPVWGDGATDPPDTEGPANLAAEAFDSAIRDGLIAFFHRALHRDATKRFESLKAMRDGWEAVFRQADEARPARSIDPEPDAQSATVERDRLAAAATRETPLEAAGLSPRAISAAQAVDVTTVGELLKLGAYKVTVQAGVGHKTRKELLNRLRQWRAQLDEQEPSLLASTERRAAKLEIAEAEQPDGQGQTALARVGLDAIVTLLVPKPSVRGQNRNAVEATRLLLGLPDEAGALSGLPPWPKHQQVAKQLGITTGRIPQILADQRRRWRGEQVLRSVHAEVVELLQDAGRVMGAQELAAALLARRGSSRTGEQLRRAVATAAVRAAVELDPVDADSGPRLLTRRHGDLILVALEVGEDDSPETPAALALLNYADALGRAADKLAGLEVLPAPATVLRELSAVSTELVGTTLDDRRLVQLAAAASSNAAATARLEVYPRDLDHVRALRLAQAGVAPPKDVADEARRAGQPGRLTPAQVQERVRSRFPELPPLPDRFKLTRLLNEAGFNVTWEDDGYVAPARGKTWSGSFLSSRQPTSRALSRWNAPSQELGDAAASEQRLTAAGDEGGFRVLTVRVSHYARGRDELTGRFSVEPVNVTTLFLGALHELVDARPRPTWETVLAADVAEPNSRDALKLREYVEEAWRLVYPRLTAPGQGTGGPLLLHDAAPLARYDAMDLLYALRERANAGGRPVWVLCPVDDPDQRPRLDSVPVNIPTVEWIKLPDAWVANQHRSGDQAS